MKPKSLLFAGTLASFAAAWFGLIVVANSQIGHLEPQVDEENAEIYPINIAGVTAQGRGVYIGNGCNYCHTQFVRGADEGPDILRGWGPRRTVALDYIYSSGAEIGVFRNGPDLSNLGAPQQEGSTPAPVRDAQWHYNHLYRPQSVVRGSTMPSYAFLFKKRKISGERSHDALTLGGADEVPAGYEVVPTHEAKALVAYLMSLDRSHPLTDTQGTPAAAPEAK